MLDLTERFRSGVYEHAKSPTRRAAFEVMSAREFIDDLRVRTNIDASNTVANQQRPGDFALLTAPGNRIVPLFTHIESTSYELQEAVEGSRSTAAAATGYGTALPQASFSLARSFESGARVGVYANVQTNALEDAGAVDEVVRTLLHDDLLREADRLALYSSGTGDETFSGIVSQISQTQGKGVDTYSDTVLKAVFQVRAGDALGPVSILLNPADAQKLALDGAGADFAFKWNTFAGGHFVVSNLVTAGAPVVGSFSEGVHWLQRSPVTFAVARDHNANFIAGVSTITCETRATVKVVRAKALCKCSGW